MSVVSIWLASFAFGLMDGVIEEDWIKKWTVCGRHLF